MPNLQKTDVEYTLDTGQILVTRWHVSGYRGGDRETPPEEAEADILDAFIMGDHGYFVVELSRVPGLTGKDWPELEERALAAYESEVWDDE